LDRPGITRPEKHRRLAVAGDVPKPIRGQGARRRAAVPPAALRISATSPAARAARRARPRIVAAILKWLEGLP